MQSNTISSDENDVVDDDDDDDDRKPPARILVYDSSSNTTSTNIVSNNDATITDNYDDKDNDNIDDYDDDDANDNTQLFGSTSVARASSGSSRKPNPFSSTTYTSNRTSTSRKRIGKFHDDITISPSSATLGTVISTSSSTILTTAPSSPNNTTKAVVLEKAKNKKDRNNTVQQLMQMLNIPSPTESIITIIPPPVLQFLHNTDRVVLLWSATTTVATSVLVYELIPRNVMIAIIAVVMSLVMLLQRLHSLAIEWYEHTVINGNGIGQTLLPQSLYRILMEQSLHDFMTTNVQASEAPRREYRHLLLYMLPLTIEQRNQLVQRLAPSHRNALHRPGIAHWLPSGFIHDEIMRLLIGTNRFNNMENSINTSTSTNQHQPIRNQQQQQTSPESSTLSNRVNPAIVQTPTSITNTTTTNPIFTNTTSRIGQSYLLNADDESVQSDLGLDISVNDMNGDLNDRQVSILARTIGLSSPSSAAAAAVVVPPQPPFTPNYPIPTTSTGTVSGSDSISRIAMSTGTNFATTTPLPSGSTIRSPTSRGVHSTVSTTNRQQHDDDNHRTDDDDDDDDDSITPEEAAEEGNVLLDAILFAFNNVIVQPANTVTTNYVVPFMTNRISLWSNRIFTLSASVGTIGYIGGLYPSLPTVSTIISTLSLTVFSTSTGRITSNSNNNFNNNSSRGSSSSSINISAIYPSSRSVLTIMAISGGTTFGLAVFHRYLLYRRSSSSSSSSSVNNDKDNDNEDTNNNNNNTNN